MQQQDIDKLLEKFHSGMLTPEEEVILEHNVLYPSTANDSFEINTELVAELQNTDHNIFLKSKRINWPFRIAASVAALVVMLGIWTLLFVPIPKAGCDCENDIDPGTNKATLTLPNGKVIDLSDAKNGELASDQGVKIIKQADGQLLYQFNADAVQSLSPSQRDSVAALILPNEVRSTSLSGVNSLTTPRGGQYHIALPDGTNVWLNAGSTLKFPSTFEDLPERIVVLEGEAYFEVSSIKTIFGREKRARKTPFIVKTASQEVTVLGTHFNINSYPDEPDTKTTLVEGSVRVANGPQFQHASTGKSGQPVVLKPGLQSVVAQDNPKIAVRKVDAEQVVAWKDGEFTFRNEPLESIMRKIARWYNVKVVYEDRALAKQRFGGMISRAGKISEVLNVLSATQDVHFKIEGRTVTVTK